jgi:DinB superfamily
MQSKDILILANRQCAAMTLPLLEDLATAPLASPAPESGNHAHWILGHLLLSEHGIFHAMTGTPNPRESLKPIFGGGSKPDPKAIGYPPYGELLAELKAQHEVMLSFLAGLQETDLDQPSKVPPRPGFEAFFGTCRALALTRALHWMNHRGQLANCRTAAGRAPLML